jgi:hypothetical protein
MGSFKDLQEKRDLSTLFLGCGGLLLGVSLVMLLLSDWLAYGVGPIAMLASTPLLLIGLRISRSAKRAQRDLGAD